MFNLPTRTNLSFLSPTVFDLEDSHYEQAKSSMANSVVGQTEDEDAQWRAYLQFLGLLSFRDWLAEQTIAIHQSEIAIAPDNSCHIQYGEFRLYVLSAEHVLSEQIEIRSEAVNSPAQAAHFYVLLEVAEEQDEVWFRGFIRRDQILQMSEQESETVLVPLAALEPEPSRLLSYCRHLMASAIELPQAELAQTSTPQAVAANDDNQQTDQASISELIATTRTQLSQWLDNIVDEGWQAWASLQPQVAYATRSLGTGVKCGKLVHLKMQVSGNPVALVLTLTPEPEDKVSILVQLLPTGRDRFLKPNIQLSLISKKGRQLQTVTSDSRDNYIQLKSFKGKLGMRFSLKVQLESAVSVENFEI